MKRFILIAAFLVCGVSVAAADADWKRGRVYYRGICTPCHLTTKPEGIPPNAYTMAEWKDYLAADKHNKGKDTVKQYVGAAYRAEIKGGNKVAEKFAATPDADLFEDVKAFVINGAKDGDAPATCN